MTFLTKPPAPKQGSVAIHSDNRKVLITVPDLRGQGGVSSYYNSVLPHLSSADISVSTLEIGSWGREGNIFQPLLDQLSFRRFCQSAPSLIHINPSLGSKSFWRDGLFAWQAIRNGYPLLVFFRGWNHDYANIVEKKYLPFFSKTFGQADGFIVLASEFKNKLRQWGVEAPIFVETTSVDEQLLYHFDYKEKYTSFQSQHHSRILFLSRLEKEKGVFETIEAVKLLIDRGVSVSLSIAGDGSAKNEAEEYVRKLGIADHVFFLGYVRNADKIDAFSKHDIYCFPTAHGEGLPNSVLEAMAFGMPVLTTPVGGLKDVFQDGKMGFFTSSEPGIIAQQLEKLITHPDLMSQISEFNYQFAQDNFMASKVAERLVKIYQKTIEHYGSE